MKHINLISKDADCTRNYFNAYTINDVHDNGYKHYDGDFPDAGNRPRQKLRTRHEVCSWIGVYRLTTSVSEVLR